jgi:hypothetical protein
MEGNVVWELNKEMLNNLTISLPTVIETASAVDRCTRKWDVQFELG